MVITQDTVTLEAGDALLIADVQNDFLPGGALAIRGGDEIIPTLIEYVSHFSARRLPIFLTRDWHPADHCSFQEQGGIWPVHCVAGSPGAEPPAAFRPPESVKTILKATQRDREAYSAFEETSLNEDLRATRTRRLFVGGLATEYCVLNTVRDARRLGYEVVLLVDAIRAVNVHPDDDRRAIDDMVRLGATPIRAQKLADFRA